MWGRGDRARGAGDMGAGTLGEHPSFGFVDVYEVWISVFCEVFFFRMGNG